MLFSNDKAEISKFLDFQSNIISENQKNEIEKFIEHKKINEQVSKVKDEFVSLLDQKLDSLPTPIEQPTFNLQEIVEQVTSNQRYKDNIVESIKEDVGFIGRIRAGIQPVVVAGGGGGISDKHCLDYIAQYAPNVTVQNSSTVALSIENQILTGSVVTSAVNHNELNNLLLDSHPQYMLVVGGRTFTNPISGVDPTLSNHLSTKNYVDSKTYSFLGLTDTPDSYSGLAGRGLRINGSENAIEFYAISGSSNTDEYVKISVSDTNADYLLDKLIGSTTVSATTLTPGGNERLQLSVITSGVDHSLLSNLNSTNYRHVTSAEYNALTFNDRSVTFKNNTVSTSAVTLDNTYYRIFVSVLSTVNLPTSVGIQGREYNIIRTGTGNVTILPNGSEKISGDANLVLTSQWDSVVITSDNSNWIRCS